MTKIEFHNDTHTYINGNEELISVSKLIKMFEKEKDWDNIAKKYAKKNGGTAQEWQAKWREKAKLSTDVGTLLHSILEEKILTDPSPMYQNVPCKVVPSTIIDGVKYSIPIKNLEYNTIYPELMIYDLDYKVCGQSDKVIVTPTHIHIYDTKTDKELSFKAFSSEWVKPEKLLSPLQHLDNCNGNIYSLKMSMYMYMLWKQNKHLKPGKIVVEHVHLKRDEEEIPILDDNGQPIILKVEEKELPYRRDEVVDILKHYKYNKLVNHGNG